LHKKKFGSVLSNWIRISYHVGEALAVLVDAPGDNRATKIIFVASLFFNYSPMDQFKQNSSFQQM
jgi:hypothetical protein